MFDFTLIISKVKKKIGFDEPTICIEVIKLKLKLDILIIISA